MNRKIILHHLRDKGLLQFIEPVVRGKRNNLLMLMGCINKTLCMALLYYLYFLIDFFLESERKGDKLIYAHSGCFLHVS